MNSKELIIKKELHIYSYDDKYLIRNEKYKSKNKKKHILSSTFDIVFVQIVIDLPFAVNGDEPKATIRKAYIPSLNDFILFTSGDFYQYFQGKEYLEWALEPHLKEKVIDDESAINYIRYNILTDILDKPIVDPFKDDSN